MLYVIKLLMINISMVIKRTKHGFAKADLLILRDSNFMPDPKTLREPTHIDTKFSRDFHNYTLIMKYRTWKWSSKDLKNSHNLQQVTF